MGDVDLIDQNDLPKMRRIADVISNQQCILFVGAGIHCPPPPGHRCSYPESQQPLSSKALSKHLADLCDFQTKFPQEGTDNLARVSQYYEMLNRRQALVQEIRGAVNDRKSPSPLLRNLAKLKFPMIVTTNYDQLFEAALRSKQIDPSISIYSKDDHAVTTNYPGPVPSGDRPFLFKIHGDVDRQDSIVITDEDYIRFVMRMGDKQVYNPIPHTFSYFFTQWTTLFIGYSLMDYNLRLLFQTLRWRIDDSSIPLSFSNDYSPDPLIVYVFEQKTGYVSFVITDAWKFVPALYCLITGEEEMPCE